MEGFKVAVYIVFHRHQWTIRSDFNILADKAFQKLYQNPDDCISYSQGLLVSDQGTEHKIILQNIISQAFAMKGDYVQSVNIYSQKEDAGLKKDLSYFLQVFGDYSLADQYQNLDCIASQRKLLRPFYLIPGY
ncbi:hypothetical protein EJ377_14615 [Chryseobacterium arthrosphaerae]|uniref:Uncharacterized protein n=1 Tax=Chryseobacterium arthrosphaerae TaxID=651561 RepID=A0A3S0Q444_9FLAO|nr:hypothetical protein EJ377_14615 [Chryseobacterium arthrosphaerae]